jgi:iron(III) transport system substrate-binding protein
MTRRLLGAAFALLLAAGASGCHSSREVWVYTSMYKEVIAEMKPLLARDLPGIEVRFFQGGSENVAARVSTEMFAGRTQADLILTSDPFWYLELKKAGKLQAYDSPAAREVPARYADPDHFFTTVRICLMVIGYNPQALGHQAEPPAGAPKTFRELADARFVERVSMASPIESGTTFTAVAQLARAFGWDWFAGLRRGELIAAGGNGSVINRMETRERPVGVVLLENILKARAKGSPVRAVYPRDGAIVIPSPIALTRDSRHPELARRVYDWFFGDAAQNAIVHGAMYSPIARIAPPAGAEPWAQVERHLMPWDAKTLEEIYRQREAIKSRFAEVALK